MWAKSRTCICYQLVVLAPKLNQYQWMFYYNVRTDNSRHENCCYIRSFSKAWERKKSKGTKELQFVQSNMKQFFKQKKNECNSRKSKTTCQLSIVWKMCSNYLFLKLFKEVYVFSAKLCLKLLPTWGVIILFLWWSANWVLVTSRCFKWQVSKETTKSRIFFMHRIYIVPAAHSARICWYRFIFQIFEFRVSSSVLSQ